MYILVPLCTSNYSRNLSGEQAVKKTCYEARNERQEGDIRMRGMRCEVKG